MASLITLETTTTYANQKTAQRAVEKSGIGDEHRYIIVRDEVTGRFFPVFIGGERATAAGIHFKFHVVG